MNKIVLTVASLVAMCGQVMAQGGEQLLQFSRYNFGMATARSAAMGGAYTSLGADAASMSINPAGLAMYNRSHISITPMLRLTDNTTTSAGENSTVRNNTKLSFNSLAGVYANGTFAVGIGYNRLADFAGHDQSYGTAQGVSMGQQFAEQLYGINYKSLSSEGGSFKPFFNNYPVAWGAIMGYQGYLINNYGEDSYNMAGVFQPEMGDKVTPQMWQERRGAVDEYLISGAYNYDGILYVGASIAFQNQWYSQNDSYSEVASVKNKGELNNWTYRQSLRQYGFGFNIKVGAIVRPVPWLRIGVSYHSPTWSNMREESWQDMTLYKFNTEGWGESSTPSLENNYHYRTPSRLLAGISFTIARRVIISADYERTWYGSMKYNTNIMDYGFRPSTTSNAIDKLSNIADNMSPTGSINLNNIISQSYRTTNNFRVGVEAQPADGIFLRVGYAYFSSPYKAKELQSYGAIEQWSGGVGYHHQLFSLDLTYTNAVCRALPYKYFDFTSTDGYRIASEGEVLGKEVVNNILLTVGFRF
ncbi:MAG: hypothetical protein RR066_04755 [Mucinivorans sp.]